MAQYLTQGSQIPGTTENVKRAGTTFHSKALEIKHSSTHRNLWSLPSTDLVQHCCLKLSPIFIEKCDMRQKKLFL